MGNQIKHEGTVISIHDEHIQVHILQASACSSCHAASRCMASESKVKIIDVWTKNADEFKVGDEVVVEVENRVGVMSVMLGFVAPVIMVLAGVMLALLFTDRDGVFYVEEPYNQAVAAITGLFMLVPYYLSLYVFRNRIGKKISFSISHLNA